ncbi:hypothetical protein [Nocardia wallacei]|uniref:hypothetical protein n=1 Tax=Nocardia wallacei TaxID=480035 RepID=UPI002458616E|nr:hypothetical protein [Nocardia wallacei]
MTTRTQPNTVLPGLADQMRSELIKVRSVRSLRLLPLLAVLLAPIVALVVGSTGSLEPDDTVMGGALTGVSVTLVVVAAWGALLVTTEFGSGTIGPVLAATPRRGTVLAAKATVAAGVSTLIGAASPPLAYLVGILSIDTTKHAPGQLFPGLLGIGLCFPAVAVLGLAVGVVVRNSAGAIALVGAHLVLPQMTAAQAVGDLHRWVTIVAPSAVVGKLSQSSDAAPEIMGSLGGWPRLGLVLAGVAGALVAARRIWHRADV